MSNATGTGFMTAEDRAQAAYEACAEDRYHDAAPCKDCFASAIRAAENDALDRAARLVADEMGWGLDARWVADLIRSLKSKEPA